MFLAQTEIEYRAHGRAIEAPAGARIEDRARRQRRPPDEVLHSSPNDPGRPPGAIRRPDPTGPRSQCPSAIVKNCRTPGIVRLPKPTGIRVHPMSTVAVRPPRAVGRLTRLPAPSEVIHFDPCAIRSQCLIEVSYFRGRILLDLRFDLRGIRGGRLGVGGSSRRG